MFISKKLTSENILALLNCRRLPARLTTGETAAILGFQEHDIPVLVTARLLTPLGKPAVSAPKYFAALDILAVTQEREWLSQATRAIGKHWQIRNGYRKTNSIKNTQMGN